MKYIENESKCETKRLHETQEEERQEENTMSSYQHSQTEYPVDLLDRLGVFGFSLSLLKKTTSIQLYRRVGQHLVASREHSTLVHFGAPQVTNHVNGARATRQWRGGVRCLLQQTILGMENRV